MLFHLVPPGSRSLLSYGGPHIKTCSICHKEKPALDFRLCWGRWERGKRCTECLRASSRSYQTRRPKKPPKVRQKKPPIPMEIQRHKGIIDGVCGRAKNKGLPCDLRSHKKDVMRRLATMTCELTGQKMTYDGTDMSLRPSIDRIIPKLGYVYSNIRIVCCCMNAAMSHWGEQETYNVMYGWFKRVESRVAA